MNGRVILPITFQRHLDVQGSCAIGMLFIHFFKIPKGNLTSKPNCPCDRPADDQAYDIVTGDNESPFEAPEFLAGRMPSTKHLHSSHDDLNPLLDTTIPAQERTVQAPELDPINRLADKHAEPSYSPTAHYSLSLVNSNTITFHGKSEKC